MKKVILFAAVLAVSATAASAQSIEWGAKAGLNLANVTEMDHNKMRPGFYAGVFAEQTFSDFFGVQAELMYSQMGMKIEDYTIEQVKFEGGTSKMDYLVLPILAKLYVLPNLSVDLGPQFGYMLSAKDKYDGGKTEDVYDDDNLNKFDAAFAMGLSYKFAGNFDVSARYNLGLTKIYDGRDSKNGVLSVGVGYRF